MTEESSSETVVPFRDLQAQVILDAKGKGLYNVHSWLRRKLLQNLLNHGVNQDRILDVNCRDGQFALILSALGFTVTALDANKKLIDYCKKNQKAILPSDMFKLDYVHHDIEEPLEAEEKFNTIVAVGILEHMTQLKEGMQNLAALLRPSGRLYAAVPFKDSFADENPKNKFDGAMLAAAARKAGLVMVTSFTRSYEDGNVRLVGIIRKPEEIGV